MMNNFLKNILKLKRPEDLLAETKSSSLKKTLNGFDLVILGIGAIIGAGIFSMIGAAVVGHGTIPGAGPSIVISMIVAAIACIFSALCYAEFASMIPAAGGVYTYTYATLGEFAAWTMGWILILQYAIGNITVACSWTGYFFQFIRGFEAYIVYLPHSLQGLAHHLLYPPLWLINDIHTMHQHYPDAYMPMLFGSIPIALNVPAIFMTVLVTAILIKGMSESKNMASALVIIKLAVIALFVVLGAFYVKPAHWGLFTPNGLGIFAPNGLLGICGGAFTIFFAYIGFDAISTAAEETKNPQKDVPFGIIGSLVLCTIIYIFVALVLTGMTLDIDIKAPIAAAMANVGQGWIAGFISLGALAGLTSVLLVMQLAATRIMFAMSRDRFFPSIFTNVHSKFKTPHIITIAVGLLIIIGTLFIDFGTAAEICNFGVFTSFMVVCIGVLILRKTNPDRERPFKVPCVPYFPALGILVCASLMVYAAIVKPQIGLLFIGWILLGIGIYFSYGYKKNFNNEIDTQKKVAKQLDSKKEKQLIK